LRHVGKDDGRRTMLCRSRLSPRTRRSRRRQRCEREVPPESVTVTQSATARHGDRNARDGAPPISVTTRAATRCAARAVRRDRPARRRGPPSLQRTDVPFRHRVLRRKPESTRGFAILRTNRAVSRIFRLRFDFTNGTLRGTLTTVFSSLHIGATRSTIGAGGDFLDHGSASAG